MSGGIPEGEGENLIAIASDRQEELDFMKNTLIAKGYEVTAAATGDALLDVIHETKPDLIIIRPEMEQMGGIDSIVQIRKMGGALRKIPILFLRKRGLLKTIRIH